MGEAAVIANAGDAPRHVPIERARHFTFSRPIEAALVAEAKRRGVSPTCLAAAIVQTAIQDDLLTAIFDDRSVEELAAPRPSESSGLTPMQATFLLEAAKRVDETGILSLTNEEIAEMIGAEKAATASRLRSLMADMGVIRVLSRTRQGAVQQFTITDIGWKLARELAGAECFHGKDA
jgi:hypothetical protein